MDLTPYVVQFGLAMAIGAPLIAAFHWWERRRLRQPIQSAVKSIERELDRRQSSTDSD